MKKIFMYSVWFFLFAAIGLNLYLSGCAGNGSTPGNAAYKWHTFYGSTLPDRAYNVVTDGENNAYIVGRSKGTWNGPAGQEPLHAHSDIKANAPDFFVLKLASDGTYQWHTFYGTSAGPDYAFSVAVDGSNNVYITGFSYKTWNGPLMELPLHAFSGGNKDAFVLKLTSEGVYQWHTFYGSTDYEDEGQGIALDGSGNIYVAIKSYEPWKGPSGESPINAFTGDPDDDVVINIAVLKLNSEGTYQWHTFFGADGVGVEPSSIAVDGSSIYVAGLCSGTWDGPTGQTPLNSYAGGDDDAFVLKLTSTGDYQWHTFYGSTANDWANGIAVKNGNVYVTGFSNASWNGPSAQLPRHAYSGGADITVFELDSAGVYQWHTFYGSASADDYGLNLAFDKNTGLYIVGRSYATWQGDNGANPLHAYTGGADIIIFKLNDTGDYSWHTFYGSASDDWGQGIALDSRGNIHAIGYSTATWNGPSGQSPLHAYTGDMDIIDVVLR